jgi:hypothetical protein
MATGNITVTTAANFIPEIWSKDAQLATENNLVTAKLVNTQFESDMEYGDTLHIPQVSNLTARAKSAGTDVTFETFTEGVIDVSINKHYYAAFKVEDIVEIQANQDLRARYTDKMGYALAKQMDADLLGLYSGLSQSVGVQGTNITETNFLRAVQYLDDADAPAGDRFAIITPAQMHAILNISNFVLQSSVGYSSVNSPKVTAALERGLFDPTKVKGLFGMMYGVLVYISGNIQTTGTSPLSYHNLLFHRDAFLLVRQQDIRVQAQYKVESLATDVVADTLYGVAEYRDAFGVRILS